MSSIAAIPTTNITALTIMATRAQDQQLVAQVAAAHGVTSAAEAAAPSDPSPSDWRRIVPAFGWHPWFSYQLYDDTHCAAPAPLGADDILAHYRRVLVPSPADAHFLQHLPAPRPLSDFLAETRRRLERFPLALVGEVGLDRAFRLPEAWLPAQFDARDHALTPGGREGRRLSPYRVQQSHQVAVLVAQLRLAGEMRRPVSLHGVQAHGVLFDAVRGTWTGFEREVLSQTSRKRRKSVPDAHAAEIHEPQSTKTPAPIPRPYPPRICLHSYSGPPEFAKQYLHPSVPVDFYFSFSVVINFTNGAGAKTEQVIRELPGDRVLVESDMHVAGEQMESKLEEVAGKICELKGWSRDEGRRILAVNWRRFVFGDGD